MTSVDVVVVGGGIGGLANALALSRKGLRVRVLERAREFGEVGAGLQIAPNCTRILDHWGLLDEIVSLGVLPEHIVMKDALDGSVLTRLDLHDVERRYGFPYVVIHRSDLHGTLLRACREAGVDLVTSVTVTGYEQAAGGAVAVHEGGREFGRVVIAADGLHSVARRLLSDDEPVSSAYVAYRGAVPFHEVSGLDVHPKDVVVYIGPRCHFVQYPLRQGEMFNQVAVFESPKALAGEAEWGTPDELDAAFEHTCAQVRAGLPLMWRDRWWRMFDRDPIMSWVTGRIALTGDAAHPPLQYLAQGAVMAIEDAWVLSEHAGGNGDWDAVLAAYDAVRPEHCRRVVTTARAWGNLWHHDGDQRLWRNDVLRGRDVHDYTYVDWLFGPTALTPEQEPPMFPGAGAIVS
ncbi:Putative n-hydroxybenzoate hydroxylase [[Actinomadura] parvosata subsp. kistnae]|uniref:3-hydroxybenzoate 6-hydroxylase n=1 Tax=[Actinomadura] parvosata subsp. kistnae TaxID=1909395 RepID=A0A1U9ZRW0_9ACTN|nr:FAD-dependent oxidoreductase [Nonomuraea sp. ATCC 55076]AQZ60685.1 3-hydroxybenzoate 6-hydroxylase [Nonomuraea sp. ATCC 55076]SPL90712.1 Putative n-hydroxybenzoate hydroxylase [Actinomadura parvosata subsp. kistnae]